jgi:hypothetical protein
VVITTTTSDQASKKKERTMERTLITEIDVTTDPRTDEDVLVHEWRAEQLRNLGLPEPLADEFADHVDWREVAALVERGCPAQLALEIVR